MGGGEGEVLIEVSTASVRDEHSAIHWGRGAERRAGCAGGRERVCGVGLERGASNRSRPRPGPAERAHRALGRRPLCGRPPPCARRGGGAGARGLLRCVFTAAGDSLRAPTGVRAPTGCWGTDAVVRTWNGGPLPAERITPASKCKQPKAFAF